jgi:hypothetical protein
MLFNGVDQFFKIIDQIKLTADNESLMIRFKPLHELVSISRFELVNRNTLTQMTFDHTL